MGSPPRLVHRDKLLGAENGDIIEALEFGGLMGSPRSSTAANMLAETGGIRPARG